MKLKAYTEEVMLMIISTLENYVPCTRRWTMWYLPSTDASPDYYRVKKFVDWF